MTCACDLWLFGRALKVLKTLVRNQSGWGKTDFSLQSEDPSLDGGNRALVIGF